MSAGAFPGFKQKALRQAAPFAVHLEITYACNWRCVFCYNPRHHDRVRLSYAEWLPVLDDLRTLGTLVVTLTGGEALAHPEFFDIAEAVRARAFALRVLTNGALVDDARAERIAGLRPLSVELSLHGACPATHDKATGCPGSFEALWRGVEHLRAAGATIKLKTPLTNLNEAELDEMVALAASRELPYSVDPTLTPRDDGDRSPLAYAASPAGVERLMERLAAHGQLPEAERQEGGTNCGLGRLTLAIDPEGEVYPCIQWRRSSLGNVRERRLADLWRTSLAREEAAEVARAANAALLEAGGAAARFPFCPAVALATSGDALHLDAGFQQRAAAAERVRSLPVAASPAREPS